MASPGRPGMDGRREEVRQPVPQRFAVTRDAARPT